MLAAPPTAPVTDSGITAPPATFPAVTFVAIAMENASNSLLLTGALYNAFNGSEISGAGPTAPNYSAGAAIAVMSMVPTTIVRFSGPTLAAAEKTAEEDQTSGATDGAVQTAGLDGIDVVNAGNGADRFDGATESLVSARVPSELAWMSPEAPAAVVSAAANDAVIGAFSLDETPVSSSTALDLAFAAAGNGASTKDLIIRAIRDSEIRIRTTEGGEPVQGAPVWLFDEASGEFFASGPGPLTIVIDDAPTRHDHASAHQGANASAHGSIADAMDTPKLHWSQALRQYGWEAAKAWLNS
jgi:hypothetical protein